MNNDPVIRPMKMFDLAARTARSLAEGVARVERRLGKECARAIAAIHRGASAAYSRGCGSEIGADDPGNR